MFLFCQRGEKEMKIAKSLSDNRGQIEIIIALIVAVLVVLGIIVSQQTEKEKELEESRVYEEAWQKAYDNPSFYGERLIVDSPPEEAFALYLDKGERFIDRYQENEKEKVDLSIYAYGYFYDEIEPTFSNTLVIGIYNNSRLPMEMSYYDDRYYVQTYGDRIYQLENSTIWIEYEKVINPQDSKSVWLIFPDSISKIDIKNIVIKLAHNGMVIGLQKIPR